MIDLNEVAIFTTVVDEGSFSSAAKRLGLPRSTVSRKVSQLEDDLGVLLLHRTTRKLRLTDAGRDYYLRCGSALSEIAHANEAITESQQTPSGVLRIAAPLASQREFMSDWMLEFLTEHEAVSMEINLSDDVIDLIDARIDIAFRAGKLEDSSLIAKRLGQTHLVLCASPHYLAASPPLRTLKDLKRHTGILFGIDGESSGWRLGRGKRQQLVQMPGRVIVNSMEFTLNACLKGLGIAQLPLPLVAEYLDEKRLQTVLDAYASDANGLYAIYPSRRHLSAAARAFLEFIGKKAEAGLPWDKLLR
ncbi:MAG: LysR family transcriptional regulator [Candidatus Thiodiazotropha sp. (ex Monitilora ramsayi)]|nr:LysR family transcriptional regulator [Candidatus Thiodiazotropha sp. (ex Monitilora ramsayi)]